MKKYNKTFVRLFVFLLKMFFVLLCCCLVALCQGVLGEGELHIKNTSEFIQFSNNVSSGISYLGTTVFLDADLDLSQQLEPIGYYKSNSDCKSFQGTFDGQGHTISNLAINSSSEYVGLFGHSRGATIRNVVLDGSCSFVNSYSGSSDSNVCTGGIIGQCSDCSIENTVNMANISFTGNTSSNLYIGGIAAYLYHSGTVKNCVNYGSIHTGAVGYPASIGGIVGESGVYSLERASDEVFIQNCLNYGTIIHNETTGDNLYIGGILGYAYSGTNSIENCVNGGKITSNKESDYIGSVVGGIGSGITTNIKHCYWSSDVYYDNAYGGNKSVVNVDSETKQVILNTTTVNNLNSYNSSWNKWLLNTNSKTITFKVNNCNGFSISSQLILLPSLAESENHTFSSWFEDKDCTKEFTNASIEEDTVLYGVWSYVLTFDFGNGTTSSKSVVYGQKYGELPSATKTGHTFNGWFTEKEEGKGEKVTENSTVTKGFDHTLYAQWTINSYTITFDFGNGTVVNEILSYNEAINYPVNITIEGFAFNGWVPRPERMPANDTTVVAQWTESATSEYVEIVFYRKSITEEELKEIIKRYTDEEFTIERIEKDEGTGEIIVIIQFKDKGATENFVDAIRESSDSVAKVIKVSFFFGIITSFSIETKLNMLAKLMLFFI